MYIYIYIHVLVCLYQCSLYVCMFINLHVFHKDRQNANIINFRYAHQYYMYKHILGLSKPQIMRQVRHIYTNIVLCFA